MEIARGVAIQARHAPREVDIQPVGLLVGFQDGGFTGVAFQTFFLLSGSRLVLASLLWPLSTLARAGLLTVAARWLGLHLLPAPSR